MATSTNCMALVDFILLQSFKNRPDSDLFYILAIFVNLVYFVLPQSF